MQDVLNLEVAAYTIESVAGWLDAHAAVAICGAMLAALGLAARRYWCYIRPAGT